MITIKFILLIICTAIAYILGYIFTETKYDLQKYPIFDFEAFKCRKCLSFHISWVLNTFTSTLFNDWIMLVLGIIFSFFLFLGLKIDENNRFKN